MKTKIGMKGPMTLLVVVLSATAAFAADWTTYKAEEYGFSMLIPKGAEPEEAEEGDWGGMYVKHEGVEVWGVARLGEQAKAEEIEAFGVKQTGVPAKAWTKVDEGKGNGWTWYRTVKATDGTTVVYGGYGTGAKGSYLLLLKTTAADFKAHEADYMTWYKSVKLN